MNSTAAPSNFSKDVCCLIYTTPSRSLRRCNCAPWKEVLILSHVYSTQSSSCSHDSLSLIFIFSASIHEVAVPISSVNKSSKARTSTDLGKQDGNHILLFTFTCSTLTHSHSRVPLGSVVCYSHTFENKVWIEWMFRKCLNESDGLASDPHFSFKCFPKSAILRKIFPKSSGAFWLLWVLLC